VVDAGVNSVTVINTATNTVVTALRVGALPVHVSISHDGTRAYVTNAGSNSVSIIDISTNAASATAVRIRSTSRGKLYVIKRPCRKSCRA